MTKKVEREKGKAGKRNDNENSNDKMSVLWERKGKQEWAQQNGKAGVSVQQSRVPAL